MCFFPWKLMVHAHLFVCQQSLYCNKILVAMSVFTCFELFSGNPWFNLHVSSLPWIYFLQIANDFYALISSPFDIFVISIQISKMQSNYGFKKLFTYSCLVILIRKKDSIIFANVFILLEKKYIQFHPIPCGFCK